MNSEATMRADRGLIAHAAIMTLLGILSGFTPPLVRAPSAALEAHTIGVLQGALLFGLAAIWPALGPSRTIVRVARYCALVGFYGNWIGSQLAAIWSARAMFSVTGASMPSGASTWMELTVGILLSLSFGIILMCILILWSLRSPAADSSCCRIRTVRALATQTEELQTNNFQPCPPHLSHRLVALAEKPTYAVSVESRTWQRSSQRATTRSPLLL